MKPPRFEYHAPGDVDEALALLGRYGGEAKLLAGGQSLMPLLNFRLSRPAALVDLNGIRSLAYIEEDAGHVRFGAMTRLDENRAVAQLAQKLGVSVSDVQDLVVWGNHSPTMFPDLFNATVNGAPAVEAVDDMAWYENEYLPNVGKRGAAIIEARGASSAASAANAAIDHVHDWVLGTKGYVSMAVPSQGQYGVAEGIISSFPVAVTGDGSYAIVEGLEVGEFAQSKIDITVNELKGERDAVKELGLIG